MSAIIAYVCRCRCINLVRRKVSGQCSIVQNHCLQFKKYQSNYINSNKNMAKFVYPNAKEEDILDVYHGVEIRDPYRWMEDPENPDVKKYVDDQNKISRPYLNSFPDRENISSALRKIWNYPKFSCPYRHGNKFFFYKNTGLQNQSVFYVQDNLDDEPRLFLDPNSLSPDGTISLAGTKFSEDGKTFAYGLSVSGSDWITIHFRNVDTGKDYSDILTRVKFSSMTWAHDNKGIFYGKYPEDVGNASGTDTEMNYNQKIYYHELGKKQSEDVLVAEFPEEPEFRIGAEVTDCGNWLIFTPIKGCKNNLLYVANLNECNKNYSKIPLRPVVTKLEYDYEYVTNTGNFAIFRTNKNAPNYRLIQIDLTNPEENNWKIIIEEHSKDVLDWATPINNDQLIVCYIQDVKNALCLYSATTGEKIYDFHLEPGTISGFSGKKQHTQCFYFFTSFTNPGVIYKIDLFDNTVDMNVFRQIQIPNFDPNKFETKQIFYTSKDGTSIPMFLVSKSDLEKSSQRACLLYGYGGFNVSIQPSFNLMRIMFIHHFDGLLAVPNIRGGGEYGEKWHNAGRFFNKQNVFDDFQYAAKYLIENEHTSSKKLAIQGASNGGLLVGACINQAPDLYQAAIAQVGVMDMLRFHKFTIGYAWTTDYGCSDNEQHFKNLIQYSPLHNIKSREGCQYPATLLLTADHDDRVVPSHSLKFIATLQKTIGNRPEQENPLIMHVETKAGHGGGKPTTKLIEESVDILCFLGRALGLKFLPN